MFYSQGITGNPIYALATSGNITTVATSYDNYRWYNGPSPNIYAPGVASIVSPAQEDRIEEIQGLIDAAVLNKPASDVDLRTTIQNGIGYASMSTQDKIYTDFIISSM